MKHLILAASLTLIAAPAFAGSVHDTDAATAPKASTYNDTQAAGYSRDYDRNVSATEARNARMRHNTAERSDNARAAWAGSVHYY